MASDNCGVLEYVRIEFAGFEVYANNELNGLTLGGCGSNTIVRNVQVHRALDDGVEVFGGSVDLKNILVSGADDDALDWDMGWTGRLQFLLVHQYAGAGDNAIEADNLQARHGASPRSEPTLYNISLLSHSSTEKHQRAMTLRRGTGGHFNNVLISGFSAEAIDIQDSSTVENLDDGQLSFAGLLIHNIGADGQSYFADESGQQEDDGGLDEASYFAAHAELGVDPLWLGAGNALQQPDFRLDASSPAARGAVAIPQGEFWDEAAFYRGAIRPGSNSNWTDGWTAFARN